MWASWTTSIVLAMVPARSVAAAREPDASAEPDAPMGSAPEPRPSTLERSGQLFASGMVKYERSDFEGAIADWTAAYDLLPDVPETAQARSTLLVNIARAQTDAYGIDKDITRMRQADALFDRYLASLPEAETELRAQIEQEQGAIRATIAQAEAEAAAAERERRDVELRAREAAVREAVANAPAPSVWIGSREARRHRTRIIVGSVLGGVGLVMGAVAFVGLARGRRLDDQGTTLAEDPTTDDDRFAEIVADGRTANRLATVAGTIAVALVVSGVAVIAGAEVAKRRDRRRMGVARAGAVLHWGWR